MLVILVGRGTLERLSHALQSWPRRGTLLVHRLPTPPRFSVLTPEY